MFNSYWHIERARSAAKGTDIKEDKATLYRLWGVWATCQLQRCLHFEGMGFARSTQHCLEVRGLPWSRLWIQRCEQVYGCLWVSERLSVGERWGERLSFYTVLVCVNNLVCSTAPQGVKVWGSGSLLRVASVMLTCCFLNSTCPQGSVGFMSRSVTDFLTWF